MTRRSTIELAFLLPWLGAFLFTPPVVLILQAWSRAAAFPLFIIYIFSVWIVLIGLGGLMSARLAHLEDASSDGSREELG